MICVFLYPRARAQLVHQDVNKRHLTAEWVMPVMPDTSLWPNTYTTVMFDKDPAADDTVKGSEVISRSPLEGRKEERRMDGGDPPGPIVLV